MWQHFSSLNLGYEEPTPARKRYSVTADVLMYQRCSIQYGTFAVRNYQPALEVQLFYGTIIHQVLDRAHAHYAGQLRGQRGSLPTDSDIAAYFDEVENALVVRGIRTVKNVRDQALNVLQRFNRLEGPQLYPRIVDTECRLQSDKGDYILHGNVDVLARSEDDRNGEVEIWDYKGSEMPSRADAHQYEQYIFQMQVYADLYRQKTGVAPAKAILYFLNSLAKGPEPTERPSSAVIEVDLDPVEVQKALRSFGQTVQEIEERRTSRDWIDPAIYPTEPTCDACDLRWACTVAEKLGRKYSLTYP